MGALDSLGRGIDAIADVLSPSWGNRRAAQRATREMLDATTRRVKDANFRQRRQDRLRSRSFKQADKTPERELRYVSEDRSINSLLEDQLSDLQVQSIGLYGENGIAHSAVESRVSYEVGAGIKLKPMVLKSKLISEEKARRVNEVIKETLRCWSLHGVDKSRRLSMPMAQRLIVREFANYGECFLLIGSQPNKRNTIHRSPIDTAIEFISPMRVETPPEHYNNPDVRLGVRYENKEIVGYYVRKGTPNDTKEHDQFEFTYYPRFDSAGRPRMLHVFDPMFSGQARGIPWITAAMNKMLDFDDYQEAEIIAKQVEACFGLIFRIKKQDPADTLYDYAHAAAGEVGEDGELMESISPAFIQRIGEEDEVTTVDPARPGSNYAPFLEGSLRMISAAINMPYEIVAKNFHRTTFASGQLALNDGDMGFCMRRSVLEDTALKPLFTRAVWDRVLADEADGEIPIEDFVANPDVYTNHKYQFKKIAAIDEVKQIKAFATGREEGVVSKADYHDRNSNDWEAQEDQIKNERRREIDDQLELEKYEQDRRLALGLPDKNQEPDPDSNPDRNGSPARNEAPDLGLEYPSLSS